MSTLALNLIAAVDQNRAIGKQGRLPWHLPADLKRFKALTLGGTVLMGRKTLESIGRVLPGRTNFVLTRSPVVAERYPGVRCFAGLDQALLACSAPELWVIGGGEIYQLTIALAQRLELTHVQTQVEGADAFFPEIPTRFVERRAELGSENGYQYRFSSYTSG